MRQVIAGDGSDSTAAVAAWLASHRELTVATLLLIGDPEDPQSIWLTDWEAPLCWPVWTSLKTSAGFVNAFDPAIIKRGKVESKIGLAVSAMELKWSPRPAAAGITIDTSNPYQLAAMGFYDNWPVRLWKVYMPTPGDANSFGASILFGGRVADSSVTRGLITITVNSFLDVVNQQVPTNVIELTNTLAAYKGATPPTGQSRIPQFSVIAPSTTTQITCDEVSPDAHHIFDGPWNMHTPQLGGGFLVFNSPPGSTLGRVWSAILSNDRVTILGVHYNRITLFTPLPWAPTPGTDTFYVSGTAPINKADGDYVGFPYVPGPQSAI